MFKMGLHDPFGWLKHKLWPKERSGVNLSIWFSTTKSRESPWLPCVQVACHISLESSRWGLQLCFRTHRNWRSAHKVMGLQSCGRPNSGNFGTPTWESQDKMTFGFWFHGQTQKILYGGRWWLPPSLGRDEFCESVFACGSSVHQKCSNFALTDLLFNLCKFVWIIEPFVTRPNPYFEAPTCPSTL
jgi:hypothetical protein